MLLPLTVAAVAALAFGCSAQPSGPTRGNEIGRPITSLRSTINTRHTGFVLDPPPPARDRSEHTGVRGLDRARRTATSFFESYLRFLYGRIAPNEVGPVDPELRSQLRDGRARITPAERTTTLRILHITVSPAGPPASATATATVLAGRIQHQVTATLEPRGLDWIVVALSG